MALRLERDGDVLKVTLARAERRNALTVAMLAELERVADALAADAEVRAVVLMADGPDFSVGMDIGAMEGGAMEAGAGGERPALGVLRRMARQGARTLRAWLEVDQPVVCAMRGVATGGGACLASVADFRVAAPDARLGYGEVRLGIPLMWNAIAPLL
ncbi:MAG: enoyl-CoA hydratase/isomerase family protein, partial [Thermaurantiacus tibetensis]